MFAHEDLATFMIAGGKKFIRNSWYCILISTVFQHVQNKLFCDLLWHNLSQTMTILLPDARLNQFQYSQYCAKIMRITQKSENRLDNEYTCRCEHFCLGFLFKLPCNEMIFSTEKRHFSEIVLTYFRYNSWNNYTIQKNLADPESA